MRPSQTELWLGLALALALLAVRWASAQAPIYVSSWAVRVTKGYQEAERLARKFGFVNLGQVGGPWGVGLDNLRPGQMGGCPICVCMHLHVQVGILWLSYGPLVEVYKVMETRLKEQGPSNAPVHRIPRSSLMTSISICGTGVWPSSL